MNLALEVILLWLVFQAAVTDLACRRIPNMLVASGLLLALLLHWHSGSVTELLSTWLAGMATGFFLFLPLYLLRGMAAGDVKLMAMTGAFAGPALALQVAVLACLFGGVLALLMLAHSGRWRLAMDNLKTLTMARLAGVPVGNEAIVSAGGIPYGVAIALATTVTVLQPHVG
jgi:prepilin peptidase CpaA